MKRKKNVSPVWSVLGLLVTITVAVFLPQLVFMVQDYKQTSTVDVVTRETFEVLVTDTAYLRDINARMSRMASIGYGDMTISKIAKSMDVNDCMDLIANVKVQPYMQYLEEMLPTTFGETLPYLSVTQLDTCDCYIVYADHYTSGVILMFWYMVFDLPELGCKVELIVDSETETIYYVRLSGTAENNNKIGQETNGTVIAGEDYFNQRLKFGTEVTGILPNITAEIESLVDNFPVYFEEYYARYYGIYYLYTVQQSGFTHVYTDPSFWENIAVGENVYTMAYALPYSNTGDGTVFFRFHAEISKEYGPNISIGIPVIRRFIQS